MAIIKHRVSIFFQDTEKIKNLSFFLLKRNIKEDMLWLQLNIPSRIKFNFNY